MLKNSVFALVFVATLGSFQNCFAADVLEYISEVHMLKARNQVEINKYILKNYNIDRTNPDQLKLLIQTRLGIENAIDEDWKKTFTKEFTIKEREYLTMLYNSPLMKRFFEFNNKFATRKQAQEIIRSNIGTKFKLVKSESIKSSTKK